MKNTPALEKVNAKLATRSDDQLTTLYMMSDTMQDLIDVTDSRYREHSIVKVCIENELSRRHGEQTAAAIIDGVSYEPY